MSGNAPVDPAEVPVFTGDLPLLDTKIKAISTGGTSAATAASDVHTTFGGLRGYYEAPEADQLFATKSLPLGRGGRGIRTGMQI
ncbi:hypothetical protein ACFWBF_25775 [Streptomyces sp. NPDC060028]|uniref:hypothetical protein n=1 Tax=Streptomyces sp. NPDC060028 TaxID=3347041 RepID=UPI0036BD4CDF